MSFIVFSILNPRFAHAQSLSLVFQQVAVVGALAVGQTLIILTAGIDLSVGAMTILSMLVMAKLAKGDGLPGLLALVVGIGVGLAAGALNGALVTRVKLPPFIVTLGTLSVFTALGLLYSKAQSIQSDQLPGLINWTGTTFPIGPFRFTTGVVMVVALYCIVAFALSQTAWGRHVYAVGDDAEAARLSGVRVKRVLFSVYAVAGLLFAVGGWMAMGLSSVASPNLLSADTNLASITAVVIGGTSLFGGRGRLVGTLLGALIYASFDRGLSLAGADQQWRVFAVGVLVLLAVSVDQWIRKVKA
jgi:fructose transport system permease protein